MSQRSFAKKLGISAPQVCKYEGGSDSIPAGRLLKIANLLNVSPALLAQGKDRQNRIESILLLDTALKVRLAQAFSQISDARIRRKLILLLEQIAAR